MLSFKNSSLCFAACTAAVGCVLGCSTASQISAKSPAPVTSDADSSVSRTDEEQDNRARAHAHYATGVLFELQQQPEAALQHFADAALADPGNELLALDVARRLLQQKQPQKAVEVLSRTAALPTTSGEVAFWLGLTYSRLGKVDLAEAAYRRAIKRNPRLVAAYQNLAQLRFQNGQKKEALKILDQASHPVASDAAFYVDLAEIYINSRAWLTTAWEPLKPRILAALDHAAKLKPDQPLLLMRLADGYMAMREYAKAIVSYRTVFDQAPRFPLIREKLADAYLQSGDKRGATEQLEAIVRDNASNAQAYFLLGSLAAEAKDYEKAASYFQKTILFNPDFEAAYFELASLQIVGLEQPKEALATLAKVPAARSQSFLVEFYSGLAYNELKNYPEALKHLTAAELTAKTTETNRLNHVLYFQLGAVYERNRDYAQAEKYFQKCLEVSPNFSGAMNYLGYMWAERGENLAAAHALIEKAVKLEPENAAFLDSLAWVLFKLNRAAEALTPLLKALALSPKPDPTLYDHLGDIYRALNQQDKAREAWQQALKVEPNQDIEAKLSAATAPANHKP